MMKKILYFFMMLIVSIGIVFLFSGCEFIQSIIGPSNDNSNNNDEISSNATHILKNWDFDDPYSNDWDGSYLLTEATSYQNNDWINGWMDEYNGSTTGWILLQDAYTNDYFRIDLGNFNGGVGGSDPDANNAFLVIEQQQYDANGNTVETDLKQNLIDGYIVNSNSKFRVRIKFIDFYGGGAAIPCFRVVANINGNNYCLFAAVPDDNLWTSNPNAFNTGYDWYEFKADLSGLVVSLNYGFWGPVGSETYTIKNGDNIESIQIQVGSKHSDIYVDYIDLYEE